MADVVNGNNLILYAQIESTLQPIGCAKSFDMTITTETIELAPKTDSSFRVYKPGKKEIRFTGSGLIKIVSTGLYNSVNLSLSQLSGQKFKVQFTLQDPQSNVVYYECDVIVTETNQSKTSGQLASYSFNMIAVSKVTAVGGTISSGVFTEQFRQQFV